MAQLPAVKKRIEFIDLLRGWAVIVMIQTHVFNATLPAEIRDSGSYQILKFIDGLVAPSFLFASGMAYAVTTRRKINDYLSFGWPLFRQIGRLLFILLIGYSLHIPRFNYNHLRYEAGEFAWQIFWQVDVLQCIAVSLLFLQVMLILLRTEKRLYMTVTGVTVLIVVSTPIMWGVDVWTRWPVPLASYMNGLHYSLFPFFPWSAFLFAGAISGYYYLRAKDRGGAQPDLDSVNRMMGAMLKFGLGIMAASFLLHPLASAIYATYDYWRVSPSFYMLRLGLVLLLCALLFWWERVRGVSQRSFITLMGRESLLVYATHLLLVYGKFGRFTFTEKVQNSFGYDEAIITTLILLACMYVLALAWSRIKAGKPLLKYAVEGVVLAGFVLVFFFGPN